MGKSHCRWLFSVVSLAFVSLLGAQPTYVGSQACSACHGPITNNEYSTWSQTRHNANQRNINPVTGEIDLSDFSTYGKVHAPWDTTFTLNDASHNIPDVDITLFTEISGDTFYKVVLGSDTFDITRIFGGTGYWKERYMTKIDSSYYIMPFQWNFADTAFHAYHLTDWYDTLGQRTSLEKTDAFERRCAGCHYTNFDLSFSTDSQYVVNPVGSGALADSIEIHIGCETCHGPGSEHISTSDPDYIFNPEEDTLYYGNTIDLDRRIETCGQCHNRGSSTVSLGGKTMGYPWGSDGEYIVGSVLSDYFTPTTSSGDFWPDGTTPKKHRMQYIDYVQSVHYSNPYDEITCFTCHDPHLDEHSGGNEHMVRTELTVENNWWTGDTSQYTIPTENDDNSLCLSCHAGYGVFVDTDSTLTRETVYNWKVNGDTAAYNLIATVVQSHTYHPYEPDSSSALSRCTKCHMPKVQKSAIAYDIHSHSFHPLEPEKTLDYQAEGGMPNACAVSCHRETDVFGIGVDPTIDDWTEATDVALAETLMVYYGPGGIWWPVSVEEKGGVVDLRPLKLYKAAPNPARKGVTLRFYLPYQGNVELSIYDITGRKIVNLLDKYLTPGMHEFLWNGKDDMGKSLSTGVYIVRLKTQDRSLTEKVLFMR